MADDDTKPLEINPIANEPPAPELHPAADEPAKKPRAKRQAKEEPADAATRLRAFEDKHLGADCVRIGDQVERGAGSPYSRLTPARHREYEALERLVASEKKLAEAHSALIAADAEHDAAMEAAAAAEAEPDAPASD